MFKIIFNMFILASLVCWADVSQAGLKCCREGNPEEKKRLVSPKKNMSIQGEKRTIVSPSKKKKDRVAKKEDKSSLVEYGKEVENQILTLSKECQESTDDDKNRKLVLPKICNIIIVSDCKKCSNKEVEYLFNNTDTIPKNISSLKKKLTNIYQDLEEEPTLELKNTFKECLKGTMNKFIEKLNLTDFEQLPIRIARNGKHKSSIILITYDVEGLFIQIIGKAEDLIDKN